MPLRNKSLTRGVTISCGADVFLFGYDQGVFGGILMNQTFLNTFDNPGSAIQAQITSAYYLGVILGAIFLCGIGTVVPRTNRSSLENQFEEPHRTNFEAARKQVLLEAELAGQVVKT